MGFAQWLEEADRQIRLGKTSVVLHQLRQISRADISRAEVLPFARIALRLGQNYWGILLLNKLVRPKAPLHQPVTDLELAMYAAFLGRIGAFTESEEILRYIPTKNLAEISLYRAQNQVHQWNYSKAIPFFARYLRSPTITPYQRLIGELNLAASQAAIGDFAVAHTSLIRLSLEFTQLGYDLLSGNADELLGQIAFFRQEFSQTNQHLNSAATKLKDSPARYMMYVRKWQLLAKIMKNSQPLELRSELVNLKNEALVRGEWESYRDCEFFEAFFYNDISLRQKVYWGTPYSEYRASRIKHFCPEFKAQSSFDFCHSDSNKDASLIDLQSANSLSRLPLILLRLLTRDFYKPIPLGQLHALLYPQEVFNPLSSPNRVNFHVDQLRKWIDNQALGLEIEVHNRSYKLKITPDLKLRLYRKYKKQLLKLAIPPKTKAKDLAINLNITERHARRLLSQFKIAK